MLILTKCFLKPFPLIPIIPCHATMLCTFCLRRIPLAAENIAVNHRCSVQCLDRDNIISRSCDFTLQDTCLLSSYNCPKLSYFPSKLGLFRVSGDHNLLSLVKTRLEPSWTADKKQYLDCVIIGVFYTLCSSNTSCIITPHMR